LGWDAVTDLDLDHYQIRYQPRGQTPAWEAAQLAVERVPGNTTRFQLPATTGTYLVKAVDHSGIFSVATAITAVLVGELPHLNYTSTLMEADPWPGVMVDVVVSDGRLRLADVGDGTIEPEGFYYFDGSDPPVDYGEIVTVRLTPDLDTRGENPTL